MSRFDPALLTRCCVHTLTHTNTHTHLIEALPLSFVYSKGPARMSCGVCLSQCAAHRVHVGRIECMSVLCLLLHDYPMFAPPCLLLMHACAIAG